MSKGNRKWKARNRDKIKACTTIGNAVRDGKIIPWPVCSIYDCTGKPEAHHPDYSTPLDVVWLCHKHHMQLHKEYNTLTRGNK